MRTDSCPMRSFILVVCFLATCSGCGSGGQPPRPGTGTPGSTYTCPQFVRGSDIAGSSQGSDDWNETIEDLTRRVNDSEDAIPLACWCTLWCWFELSQEGIFPPLCTDPTFVAYGCSEDCVQFIVCGGFDQPDHLEGLGGMALKSGINLIGIYTLRSQATSLTNLGELCSPGGCS